MKANELCAKGQTVVRILDRIQTNDANSPLEIAKQSILESVLVYNDAYQSWERPGIESEYDAQTIADGKIACEAAFDMAESIANRLYRNING